MRLSKAQAEIVELLSSGWELGISRDLRGRIWIQHGGIGRGGETKEVRSNTFYALWKAKIIICVKESFPVSIYHLAPTGNLYKPDVSKERIGEYHE